MWRDFRDDPALRVAVITGTGDAFTAGADLKTHAPEWQTVGPMVGRERLEDGLCGITRGPLSRIKKPIVAAINGWCVGHGVELAMACEIRIASERAQFGTFEVRRGMHPADGGIPRLVNTCGCRSGVGDAADRRADFYRAGADREHGRPGGRAGATATPLQR
jgi:enoyl-CoA hydratase/carnithine racemase